MRFNYMNYEIDYQEHTGDTCVYQNDREVLFASMSKWLATREVIDSLSLLFKITGLPGMEGPDYGSDFIYDGDEAC